MIQRIGACILVTALGVGCGVGDDDADPNPNKLVCTDAFKISGTFTPGTPARPTMDESGAPFTGCWPVGTWTFTVSLDPTDDNIQDITGDMKPDRCGAVSSTQIATFDASYSFTYSRNPDPTGTDFLDSIVLNGSTQEGTKTRWNDKYLYKVKVTEGGGGECEGGLELYSLDGKSYWNLHPSLRGTTLTGFGDFHRYQEPQPLN